MGVQIACKSQWSQIGCHPLSCCNFAWCHVGFTMIANGDIGHRTTKEEGNMTITLLMFCQTKRKSSSATSKDIIPSLPCPTFFSVYVWSCSGASTSNEGSLVNKEYEDLTRTLTTFFNYSMLCRLIWILVLSKCCKENNK